MVGDKVGWALFALAHASMVAKAMSPTTTRDETTAMATIASLESSPTCEGGGGAAIATTATAGADTASTVMPDALAAAWTAAAARLEICWRLAASVAMMRASTMSEPSLITSSMFAAGTPTLEASEFLYAVCIFSSNSSIVLWRVALIVTTSMVELPGASGGFGGGSPGGGGEGEADGGGVVGGVGGGGASTAQMVQPALFAARFGIRTRVPPRATPPLSICHAGARRSTHARTGAETAKGSGRDLGGR